jgi:uncharacterized protein (DUF952 family)
MALIYHLTAAADWERARDAGEYRLSTRGRSLDEVGFIHASAAHQVAPVANAVYPGAPGLVLLVIDTDLVRAPVRYDPVPGSDDPFPHIYGPLNAGAVVRVLPFGPDASGRFSFPPDES